MEAIRDHIERKQEEFMRHPFFDLLERLDSLEDVRCFVPEMTFWVMGFQDILRLNEERVSDPFLRKVARHHRLEDAGHEQWFLHDRAYMCGGGSPDEDTGWLFGKENQSARDLVYALLAEVYKSEDELLNIVLLLVMESTGHVFFDKIVQQMKKIGEDKNLRYFSSSHLKVEQGHALFEEEMERGLAARPVSASVRRDALALVDRSYGAFVTLFDGLAATCGRRLEITQ